MSSLINSISQIVISNGQKKQDNQINKQGVKQCSNRISKWQVML